MTNIYIYCVFDGTGNFMGVYSSLKNAHRDALKVANSGESSVYIKTTEGYIKPTLSFLKKTLKGKCDIVVQYRGGKTTSKILKTKLKE
jgi:hypothetical protein|tara:strand:+ start:9601 stop:9864 length:264 start_codon:yes stop_codon:yes gene_type:complete